MDNSHLLRDKTNNWETRTIPGYEPPKATTEGDVLPPTGGNSKTKTKCSMNRTKSPKACVEVRNRSDPTLKSPVGCDDP